MSRRVPATRPRPLAPSGIREEGMWSDAERVMDILKRSRRPLLSFFLSCFFLPHATTCLSPSRIEASCHNPFSLVLSRPPPRATLVLVLSRPPPRTALVLSDPVLGRRRTPFLSCPILSSAAAAHHSCPVRSCPRPPPRADLVLVPLPKALSAWPLHFVASTTLRVANDPLSGTTIVTQDVFRQYRDTFRQCRDAFRQC